MTTITSNATGGGNWSATATWAGATVPVDNDTVVIAAGDTVTLDVDMSSGVTWPNGIAGLTITSHATTPAMLRFKYDADGTYHLKIKTATTIAGTNAAAKGRLLANSDGTWGNTGALAFGRKAIIDLQGTANISALYLDIALYCTQPTNTYAEVYGTAYVVTCEADDDKVTFVSPSTTPPQAGTPITLSGTLPAELTEGTTYYVRDVSGSTCKLEATIGGGAINLTDDGSGTIYLHYGKWGPVAQSTAVNTTTGVITWDGVPPAAGTPVCVRSSGTLPTGLYVDDLYYVRTVSGNTCKLSLQSADVQIVIPSDVGTGDISMYCGSPTVFATAVVNTVTSVASDAGWITTDDHDYVVLVNAARPSDADTQRLQLTTIASRYLVLSANVDSAQYPMALVWLASRNISIRSSSSGSVAMVNFGVGTHSGVFQCEFRTTAVGIVTALGGSSAGSTMSGVISGCTYGFLPTGLSNVMSGVILVSTYAIGSATNSITISGTISGCANGTYQGTTHTISGKINGCTLGMYGGSHTITGVITGCREVAQYGSFIVSAGGKISNCNYASNGAGATINGTIRGCNLGTGIYAGSMILTGTMIGCSTGITTCTEVSVSGTISQCTTGITTCTGVSVSGTISQCTTGITTCTGVSVSGTISQCTTGITTCNNVDIIGTITGCTTGVVKCIGFLEGTVLSNTTDINIGSYLLTGWGVTLSGSALVSNYKHNSVEIRSGVHIRDFAATANFLGFWTQGGFTKTAAYAVGTHTAPPVASTFIHEMTFEDSDRVNWVEIPFYGLAGQAVTVTFYGRLTGTSAWTTRPNVGIYDPTKEWQTAPEILNASAAMASNTNWQTLTATYTPAHDRELRMRVQGVGGNAGGTGTEKLYWFHALSLGAGGGSTVIVIED